MNVVLLIALLCCHYLADYCLTLPVMIRAKADGRHLWPILLHAACHASLMAVCMAVAGVPVQLMLLLSAVELLSHFVIDVSKGRLTALFPVLADQRQKPYWVLYGLDQLLHQLVIVWMCAVAV